MLKQIKTNMTKNKRFINHHIPFTGNNKNNVLNFVKRFEALEIEWKKNKEKKYGI